MSLVRCKKCGKIVSNRLQNCIECDAIIDEYKPLEVKEKQNNQERIKHKINPIYFAIIVLVLFGVIKIVTPIKMIPVPKDIKKYIGKDVFKVEKELKEAGFTNIALKPVKPEEPEGIFPSKPKKDSVKTIYFAGNNSNVRKNEEYRSNIKIRIYYFEE